VRGFADGAAGAGNGLRLGRFGSGRHGRVPVEQPAATVAGEQFALAQLVPGLGTHAHAAAGALLVFDAGQAGAAGAGEAVVADEPFGPDERAEGLALGVERGHFGVDLLLAKRGAGAGFVQGGGEGFHLRARGGQRGFLRLAALQAGELLVFQALGLLQGKLQLVLDGGGLRGVGDRILLDAEAGSLLAVAGDLALQAGAQRILAAEGGGSLGGVALGGGQRRFGLGDLRGQRARRLRQPGTLQIHSLQLYEVFNVRLHPCQEVYVMYRLFRKWGRANPARMDAIGRRVLASVRGSFWRRNRWLKWFLGGLLAALAGLAVVVAVLLHRAEPFLRARIVEELQDRFHARVELDSFHVSLADGLWAEGKGLRIWPPAQVAGVTVPGPAEAETAQAGEPLIRLEEFRFHAPLRYRPGQPIHISLVELKGLDLRLPPKSHFEHASSGDAPSKSAGVLSFRLDNLECSGAHLVLETGKPGKLPLEFAIARFKLSNIASGGAMTFDAELTNPRPVGTIHSTGSLGPWLVADPGESPITGDYRFEHADLSSFKGIAGILSSTGHYQGTLRDLTADGESDTPDFRLTHFGNSLPLHTRFHARVDATNGDTWLDPVEATLGRSHFWARGQIVRVLAAAPGAQPRSIGHDIALTVNVDQGRIEDFLRLASRGSAPLLTGAVTLKTTLHIPPGPAPVHERLALKGAFALDQARFADAKIQEHVEELSLRGQGRPDELKTTDPASIRSRMQGDFQLAGGVLTLPALQWTVPGAAIDLKGSYALEGGALDFIGTAKTDATVSQMVGGWKGLLLKPADRLFKKSGAGAAVGIQIAGTREEPKFTVDFDGMKATVGPKKKR